MAVRPTVTDAEGFGKELVAASPDLLGSMVKAFAEALMGAEVDGICGAEYGEISAERTNRRNGYRAREWDTRAGRSSWRSRSCVRGRISRNGC